MSTVSAFGLSTDNKQRRWIRFTGCLYIGGRGAQADWLGPKVGGHLAPFLYSSREPSELSQWLRTGPNVYMKSPQPISITILLPPTFSYDTKS